MFVNDGDKNHISETNEVSADQILGILATIQLKIILSPLCCFKRKDYTYNFICYFVWM
jgi:hypothetical protein